MDFGKELVEASQRLSSVGGNSVVLMTMPPWDLTCPPLGLAHLTAFLRSKNITAVAHDLNPHFFELVMSARGVEWMQEHLDRTLAEETLDDEWLTAVRNARWASPYIARDIDKVRSVFLGNNGLIDADASKVSRVVVDSVFGLLAACNFPQDLRAFDSVWTDSDRQDMQTLSAVLRFVEDEAGQKQIAQYRAMLSDVLERRVLSDIAGSSLVGISVITGAQLVPALITAHMIRQAYPHLPIAMGGPTMNALARCVMACPDVFKLIDYFVVGEGETALWRLSQHVLEGAPLSEVPNLIYRDENGVTVRNASYVEDLDTLPTPDYSDFADTTYMCMAQKCLSLINSRGCYWNHCAFCSETHFEYREKRIELLLRDIDRLANEYGARVVQFVDNCISPERMGEISDHVIETMPGKLAMQCSMRCEGTIDYPLMKRAHEAGFRWITWGVESGSQTVLNMMHKGTRVANIERCLESSAKAGIFNNVFIIVAFPGETPECVAETRSLLGRMASSIGVVQHTSFYLPSTSPAFKHPEEYGLRIGQFPEDYFGMNVHHFNLWPFDRNNLDASTEYHRNRVLTDTAMHRYLYEQPFDSFLLGGFNWLLMVCLLEQAGSLDAIRELQNRRLRERQETNAIFCSSGLRVRRTAAQEFPEPLQDDVFQGIDTLSVVRNPLSLLTLNKTAESILRTIDDWTPLDDLVDNMMRSTRGGELEGVREDVARACAKFYECGQLEARIEEGPTRVHPILSAAL